MRVRLGWALALTLATAIAAATPGIAQASNLTVHGTAGVGGSTCALVDGRQAQAGMSTTCGNGSGNTLNAIYMNSSGTVGRGTSAFAWIDAPSGLSIDEVSVNYCSNMNGGTWGGGSFWGPSAQYGNQWPAYTTCGNGTGQYTDYPEGVPRYGFQIVCGTSGGCSNGYVYVPSFTLFATETAQPSLAAAGTDNIWYHGAQWVWNPPSQPWNATLVGSDITGVCKYQWSVGSAEVGQTYAQNQNSWTQCPNNVAWNTPLDTDAYPNGANTYQIADWNAAGIATVDTETLYIDNQAPSVSVTPAPTQTGSTVVADVSASAGPSGLAGVSCTDNGAALAITAGTVRVARNGTHRIDCQAANNAVDAQGQHNVGQATLLVRIATSRIPRLRRAHGHVNVLVVINWTWSGRHTTMRRMTVGRLPRGAHVRVICAGRGCPFRALSVPRRSIGRLERRLAGARFASSDQLMLTIAVPGRISERARLRIRDDRVPLVRRLG